MKFNLFNFNTKKECLPSRLKKYHDPILRHLSGFFILFKTNIVLIVLKMFCRV
jgi:hypothetical protein